MRALILAATVAAFAAGPAFAEGNGGTIFGYDRWQAANGNPEHPRHTVEQHDTGSATGHAAQDAAGQAGQIWGHPQNGNPSGVAQSGARQGGG